MFPASNRSEIFSAYSRDNFQWSKKNLEFFLIVKLHKFVPKDRRYLKAKMKMSPQTVHNASTCAIFQQRCAQSDLDESDKLIKT